ncbi:MAG TPA: mechanosensitive ion channel family protein [Steroidobacteraceae bacterium]|nr:mechanosensitive ion channel family protein [Gammaproteobacteria bacterium]HEV2285632.1 mechanosensitive ion channel family protein [Steroidobacteraceae bacterium]
MSGWHALGQVEYLGNSLADWLLALAIFLVTFTVLPLVKGLIAAQQRRLSARGPLQIHFAIELAALLARRTQRLFLWGAALWLASRDLTFPPRLERALTVILVVLLWLQIARWATAAVRYAVDLRRQRSSGPDTLLKSSMEVILFPVGLVIWGVAILLALDNLGVEIRPLLAGLGIGGIALALAVQAVLADLLASLSIALDKPFGLGDFLTVDDCQGSVEHIGVKSTRLRSINGEQIVISNADLLKARVRNFGRLLERRSLFVLQVHYETPVERLAAVPRAVREIIEATPGVRFDRCHLLRCTDTALEFEAVFFVTHPEYQAYADAQQSINLRILERFRAMEVSFVATAPRAVRLHPPLTPAADGGGQQRLL